jgi:D-sedoheptulose 7-phosphate isomerase
MLDRTKIDAHLRGHLAVIGRMFQEQQGILLTIAETLHEVLEYGGTIYLCGNGGSAADCQHVAAEFVGRYLRNRRALPAVALTTDTSILTAIGNDYTFEEIFARQVHALATPLDVVVGISTSGKSANVLRALQAARELDILTIGFTGTPGEPLATQTDLCFHAASSFTPHIQEAHLVAWHIICDLIEGAIDDVESPFASRPTSP